MVWNTQMKYWENSTESQLLELSEPFLGTWPTSGTMLDGQVYELVMPAHHTSDSESLFSPTLPTPNTMEHLPARTGEARERQLYRGGSNSRRNSSGNLREDILDLMPTPTTRDYKDGSQPHQRDGKVQTDTVARAVFNSGEVLLGTPRTSSANGSTPKQVAAGAPKARIEDQVLLTAWGKFEPAIRRWEAIIGRPAPEPTKPDGKEGNHRLSSKFTEWMMGLPDGWITDIGLKRNDELKACGNGVVPQQAELALNLLGIKEILER
jgi:hypothetical protein